MKSILHFFRNVSSLECKKPVICDTNLEGVKVEKLQANFLEQANGVNGCLEILTSGLIEVVYFPSTLLSPKLIQFYIYHYDVRSKSILNKDGEPVLPISRETISSVLHFAFVAFTPTQSLVKYQEKPSKYHSILARKWMETNYGGGSRLPKIVTKDHMKPHIHDLMILLHRVKGLDDVFLFEEWMYRYVEIILKGKELLDWAKVIASSLRSHLKHAKESRENFYMASYLTYCIACVSNITSLPHETWSEDITIYQYCPLL